MKTEEQDQNNRLKAGLLEKQAVLPPKLFYDELGSTLFTAICQVPEYYPTRTEAAIFSRYAEQIALQITRPFRLVDLGAGDCKKSAALIPALKPAAYTPIDISGEFLLASAGALAADFPDLLIEPLVRDFTTDWQMPPAMRDDTMLFFYPGSSLGNFSPPEAVQFLTGLRQVVNQPEKCQLLIGLDTVKSAQILESAYDDALGVTAAFNRNALLNANRLIGTDFDVAQWEHRSVFNAELSRIEMHLVARESLIVSWPDEQRAFDAGETIHTENSYKYTVNSFSDILDQAGYSLTTQWTDENEAFMVALAGTQS
jgi:dimethylhistidine N-methyltransferase